MSGHLQLGTFFIGHNIISVWNVTKGRYPI